jgi:hypothetical protein
MKYLILFFFLLTMVSFSQVRTFADSVQTADTTYHYIARGFEFAILTVTLPNSGDSLGVYVGTAETSPKYGRIVVTDMYADESVLTVTGNTTVNRKYFIKWGYKQKYIAIISPANSATIHYTLEAY